MTVAAVIGLLVVVLSAGDPWTPVLLPAVGVLLAHAARVAARASDHARARTFLAGGLLRVLVPFWVFAAGAALVGLDVLHLDGGWRWLLPLGTPPLPGSGGPWTATAWVVPVLLWFVLLTPPTLWLFRRWPLRLAAVPLAALAPLGLGLAGETGGDPGVLLALAVYAPCWLVGYAAHDGILGRLRHGDVLLAGGAVLGAVLWYLVPRRDEVALTLDGAPVLTMLASVAAALLLLRAGSGQPTGRWRRSRVLGAWSAGGAFLSRRSLTGLLWAGPAVVAAPGTAPAAAGALLLTAVLVLGWAEAPPRLRRRTRTSATPAAERNYEFQGNVVLQDDAVEPGRPAAGAEG